MTTTRDLPRLATLGLLACASATAARGQVLERETTVTGPRGNSITRDIRTERFGNMVDRQVTIRRPGGTITRNTEVFAPRGGGFYGPRPFYGGGGFVGGPAFFGPPVALGVGLPAVNLFVGGGGPPAPPPVTVYSPPVPYPLSTAAASGTMAAPASPQPQPAPGQPTVLVDPVAESIGKLDSFHSHTRREAAIALGKYGDARGVAPLIDKMEHDFDKEVRMAAAWALAEIGDPRAIVPLETARQFDKRADVRSVATKSLERMPREAPPATVASAPGGRRGASVAQPSSRDAEADYGYPTRRAQSSGSASPRTITSTPGATTDLEPLPREGNDDLPPPDPTPVTRPSSPR